MKFFNKYKRATENWLRGLIADEVFKLDYLLSNERAALCSTLKECGAQVNEAVDRLNELSHFKENAQLREQIKDLASHVTGLVDAVKKLHPEF